LLYVSSAFVTQYVFTVWSHSLPRLDRPSSWTFLAVFDWTVAAIDQRRHFPPFLVLDLHKRSATVSQGRCVSFRAVVPAFCEWALSFSYLDWVVHPPGHFLQRSTLRHLQRSTKEEIFRLSRGSKQKRSSECVAFGALRWVTPSCEWSRFMGTYLRCILDGQHRLKSRFSFDPQQDSMVPTMAQPDLGTHQAYNTGHQIEKGTLHHAPHHHHHHGQVCSSCSVGRNCEHSKVKYRR
jgi:hypothetical protein